MDRLGNLAFGWLVLVDVRPDGAAGSRFDPAGSTRVGLACRAGPRRLCIDFVDDGSTGRCGHDGGGPRRSATHGLGGPCGGPDSVFAPIALGLHDRPNQRRACWLHHQATVCGCDRRGRQLAWCGLDRYHGRSGRWQRCRPGRARRTPGEPLLPARNVLRHR